MGIDLSLASLLLELKYLEKLKDVKNVLEIGSQELHLKKDDLKELYNQVGLDDKLLDNHSNLDNWPDEPRESAKKFYNDLGIKDYTNIDLTGEHESIPLDLNKELTDKSLFNKFDLVTDFGSCEHVFNISECYRTMHNITKVNGIIIIDQIVFKGNGYFLFNRGFLEGLAAANKYKILYSAYKIGTGTKTSAGSFKTYRVPLVEDILKNFHNYDTEIGITMVFQKIEDKEFKIPYQGGLFNQKYNTFGFNRVYNRDDLSISYLAEYNVKHLSFKILLKEFFNRIKKRLMG